MTKLKLSLFGTFAAQVNDHPLHQFRSDKIRALLAYLAVEADQEHRRESLATLLWPNWSQQEAIRNLRVSLYRLRQTLSKTDADLNEQLLTVTRQTIQANSALLSVDVIEFQRHIKTTETHPHAQLERCPSCLDHLRRAVNLYKGEFLAGFTLTDAPTFEAWVLGQREPYHLKMMGALQSLILSQKQQGDYDEMVTYATRLVHLEPWQEEAQRHLMWALAKSGQRNTALAQYDLCRQVLADELGIEPSTETTDLYEHIKTGEITNITVLENPYRGLQAFREEDSELFYGRESFIEQLLVAIKTHPLVAVIGPSGSGKSSVVAAGLFPHLRRQNDWLIITMRPGSHPLNALKEAFSAATNDTNEDQPFSILIQAVLDHHPWAEHILLVIDQFEELYTLCLDTALRHQFLDKLLSIMNSRLLDIKEADVDTSPFPVTTILTMRADFMGQALTHRPLADAFQDATLMLGPMTAQELATAIENPAKRQGVTFEEGLVNQLLTDVGTQAGRLPLLQFALTTLWEHQTNGQLTNQAYQSIGQVGGGLARYAEQIYTNLNEAEQTQAGQILVQLVQPGQGTSDTRRQAIKQELEAEKWPVLQYLTDARLVVTDQNGAGEQTVDLAHEALIDHWGRLKSWLNDDRAFRLWQERLRIALYQWEATQRDKGALLRGALLVEAEEWCQLEAERISPTEQAFINASITLRDQEQQAQEAQRQRELVAAQKLAETEAQTATRLRKRAFALTGLGVIAIVLALLAGTFSWLAQENASAAQAESAKAQEAQRQAERQRQLTLAQSLVAQSLGLINQSSETELGTLLTLEALRLNREADGNLQESIENSLQQILIRPYFNTTLSTQDTTINTVDYSPDGQLLAVAGNSQIIQIWDTNQPSHPLHQLMSHKGNIQSIAFSPDGQHLATAGDDQIIHFWDVNGVEFPHPPLLLKAHIGSIRTLVFSPDQKWLASGGEDQIIYLWDLALPQKAAIPLSQQDMVNTLAFSPNGQYLASGSQNNLVRLWNLDRLDYPPLTLHAHESGITAIAFDPNGQFLASGSQDGLIYLWDLSQLEVAPQLLAEHSDEVQTLKFSPTGEILVSGSADQTIRLWDLNSPRLASIPLIGHVTSVKTVTFSPDGTTLASASEVVRLWNLTQTPLEASNLSVQEDLACQKVQRNLTQAEWRQYLGDVEPYRQTCANWPSQQQP